MSIAAWVGIAGTALVVVPFVLDMLWGRGEVTPDVDPVEPHWEPVAPQDCRLEMIADLMKLRDCLNTEACRGAIDTILIPAAVAHKHDGGPTA